MFLWIGPQVFEAGGFFVLALFFGGFEAGSFFCVLDPLFLGVSGTLVYLCTFLSFFVEWWHPYILLVYFFCFSFLIFSFLTINKIR